MAEYVVAAQLYSVREYTRTPEGVAESLMKVAAIGYHAVQVSGFGPVDPKDVARWCADLGLTIASTHLNWNQFTGDLDRVIEDHLLWKCAHPAVGSLPREYYSLDGLKRFLDELAPVAEKLAAVGMDFSYHNHNMELARFDGVTWLKRLYDAAPASMLKAEIDTYWIQAGGGDPAWWVEYCAGREPLLHLKDMAVTPEREQRFAEIGEGNLNWPRILEAASRAGVEWYFVEQDRSWGHDAFEALAISYRNLNAMGLR